MLKQEIDNYVSLLHSIQVGISDMYKGNIHCEAAVCTLKKACLENKIPLEIIRNSDRRRQYTEMYVGTLIADFGLTEDTANLFRSLIDFFSVAPASTNYHGNYFGGLLDHTVLVCTKVKELAKIFNFDSVDNLSQLVMCALFHDLGKLGSIEIFGNGSIINTPMFIMNPDFSKHETEPFIYNKDLISMPHELRTLKILHDFNIRLTDEEYQAIYYHAGAYKPNYLNEVKKESRLAVLLHSADNLVAKIFNC